MDGHLKLVETLRQRLEQSDRVLVVAYPGFGKSRAIPHICRIFLEQFKLDRVLVLTRSVAEVLQLVNFFKTETPELASHTSFIIGREKACPFSARTSLDCVLARSDGLCHLQRVRLDDKAALKVLSSIETLDDLRKLAIRLYACPYDLLLARARQSRIVIASYSYLSNRELYRALLRIIDAGALGVIVDEAHGVITGVECVQVLSWDVVKLLSRVGCRLFEKLSKLEDGESLVVEKPDIDVDLLKQGVETTRTGTRLVTTVLDLVHGDLLLFRRAGSKLEVRVYTVSTVSDLVSRARKCVFLTASIPAKLRHLLPHVSSFDLVSIESTPQYFENLLVYIVSGVQFTHRFRQSLAARKYILRVLSTLVQRLPLVGGVAILFSSREFMTAHVDAIAQYLSNLGEKTYVVSESESSLPVLQEFKQSARRIRTFLITYAANPLMEGLNFLLDELICVVLFGFPYPEFSFWNEAKRRVLKRYTEHTFIAAYLFPALSVTIQCVGRVTRDLDRRVKYAVLVDSRFKRFLKYMPKWIQSRALVLSVNEFAETFGQVFHHSS